MTETDNEQSYPGQDREDLIAQIVKNIKNDRSHIAAWRVNARENYDFFASKQWEDEDVKKLEEQNRPPVTFNRVARVVNAVSGLELQNRQEVRFIPRLVDPQQTAVNEILTHAAKWVRDNCDAEDEESEAFSDAIICGMGWTETRMDYEVDSEGMIIIDRIDPLEMGYDRCAKKRNLADARWIWRAKEYDIDEVKARWPKYADLVNNSQNFWMDIEAQPHDDDVEALYINDQSDKLSKSSKVTVIQYQWFDLVNFYQVQDVNGKIIELNEEKFAKLMPMIKAMGARYVSMRKRQYHQMFLIGNIELETVDLTCSDFTFKCITGLRDRNNNTWFSLVSLMRDPQKWANKWLSQILHIINSNAKGGVMAEQSAFANPRKAEDDWAKSDAIIWMNPGGIEKVMQRQAPSYPEGVDRLLQYAVGAVNDVVGVSIEMLGQANRNQPGYLEEMRKTSSISLLATFFSALRYYRKKQGRVLADYIKNYIADGRLIRIVGQEGSQFVPLLRDQMTYKYDVIVDDAPTSPNMKERVFSALMQIVPLLIQAGIPVPPEVVDYTPLPEALSQKWKQMLIPDPQKQQIQQEMEQIKVLLAQLEVQAKQAQNENLVSQTQLNYAKAEKEQALGQDEAAQAAMKNDLLIAEHGLAVNQVYQDSQRKDLQMMLEQRRKFLQTLLDAHIKKGAQANANALQQQPTVMQ